MGDFEDMSIMRKAIDFEKELNKIKKRQEFKRPYTLTQVEDTMYIDKNHIMTLEFHQYQNNCQYIKMRKIAEDTFKEGFDPAEDEIMQHKLGTENFQLGDKESYHSISAFTRQKIENFEECDVDLLQGQKQIQNSDFMRKFLGGNVNNKAKITDQKNNLTNLKALKGGKTQEQQDQYQMFEGILALYRVNDKGQMRRILQSPLRMGRRFMKPANGNMTLTRSRDKKLVSIVNFDREDQTGQVFKIMAFTIRLQRYELDDNLNQGLNNYYQRVKDTFCELIEITFIGKCQYMMLSYWERKERIQAEFQEISQMLNNECLADRKFTLHLKELKMQQMKAKKARKYVIFDAKSGEVKFEYGGVKEFLEVTLNQEEVPSEISGEERKITIYDLGLLVKEIREEQFLSQLVFYYTGDFLPTETKNQNAIFKWGLNMLIVQLDSLVMKKNPNEYIKQRIRKQVMQTLKKEQSSLNFTYSHLNIIKQKYDWEECIEVAANRNFDQFSITNNPLQISLEIDRTYYVNGPIFEEIKKNYKKSDLEFDIDVPFVILIPAEAKVSHCRNSNIKDDLFFSIEMNNEINITCLRLTHPLEGKRKMSIKMPIVASKTVGQFDVWKQLNKRNMAKKTEGRTDIFQTVCISADNQHAVLSTRGNKPILQNQICCPIEERHSHQCIQQRTDYPIMVQTLGLNRLLIESLLRPKQNKKFILELKKHQKFVGFIEFQKFEDIGFHPQDLNLECSSVFLYMTTSDRPNKTTQDNQIHLLIVDPYHDELQLAVFTSRFYFDNDIFQIDDFIIKSVIQSNMIMKNDKKFKTYMWTQFRNQIVRSKLLKKDDNRLVQSEDSDNQYDKDNQSTSDDEDEFLNELDVSVIEPIEMQQDEKCYIYYIIKKNDGILQIIEGNARDCYLSNHYPIFQIKAESCLGLSVLDGEHIFLMDDSFTVYMLTRAENNRQLQVIKELTIKEIQRLEIKFEPFLDMIIRENYILYQSKIFYLYDTQEGPHPDNIFETEDLMMENKVSNMRESHSHGKNLFIEGPKLIKGSSQFYCIQTTKDKSVSDLKLYTLPDSNQKTLINDYQNVVTFSSFLQDGKILVKCKDRYLVFSSDAVFVDQVQFDNSKLKNQAKDLQLKPGFKSYSQFIKSTQYNQHIKKQLGFKMMIQLKKVKNQIKDFEGHNYNHLNKKGTPNKMVDKTHIPQLIQLSFSNKYYLFYIEKTHKLYIYELVEQRIRSRTILPQMSLQDLGDTYQKKKQYVFKVKYELDYDRSQLFQSMYISNMDPFHYFVSNQTQIKVEDDSSVKMCYVVEGEDNNLSKCKLYGAIFSQDSNSLHSRVQDFGTIFEFPNDAIRLVKRNFTRMYADTLKSIDNIRVRESRLPIQYHDYTEYNNKLQEMDHVMAIQQKVVYAKFLFDDLIVVNGGKYLKFAKLQLDDEEYLQFQHNGDHEIFKDINVKFQDQDEIIKIIETDTCENHKYILQIVILDHDTNVLKILTWNFESNMEESCLQLHMNAHEEVGYHIVKGMNYKANYFLNQNFIFDLEYNIPIMQQNVDQKLNFSIKAHTQQSVQINDLYNQRKIYWDDTKFLGIEKANCLFYSACRMDILYWRDISDLSDDVEIIKKTFNLEKVNLNFQNKSLFHYFASNPEVIQLFFDRFMLEKANNQISQTTKFLPLQILNPDNDGQTALQKAWCEQSPKSFECMVILLQDFPNICVSKMMIESVPIIISHYSEQVINFFEDAIFCPPQMEKEHFVPWKDDLDEVIFPSHTCIIWKEFLEEKLAENGIEGKTKEAKLGSEQALEDCVNKSARNNQAQQDRRKKLRKSKDQFRKFEIEEQIPVATDDFQDEVSLKRVKVEAIEMDWVFIGENSYKLINLLATTANNSALTKQSMRTFINLMWEYYQPAIIKFIFGPYLIFLFLQSYLCTSWLGPYIENFDRDHKEEEFIHKYNLLRVTVWTMMVLIVLLYLFFAALEIHSMKQNGLKYFSDPWNQIDFVTLILNSIFVISFLVCAIREKQCIKVEFIRLVGSLVSFFMWIKVFYWMRLFSSYAYYVKLIQQTLSDSSQFLVMVFIIMVSFANFFLIINLNQLDLIKVENQLLNKSLILKQADESTDMPEPTSNMALPYIQTIIGIPSIDSMISVYLLGALGSFDINQYSSGYNRHAVITMFLMATFLISVVFMNMLIAIMSESFNQVLSKSVENGLREQVVLIADHIWLLDLKKIFKGQKYIFRVRPSQSQEGLKDNIVQKIQESQEDLQKSIKKVSSSIHRSIKGIDLHTKYLHRIQSTRMDFIVSKLKLIDQQQKTLLENDEIENDQDVVIGNSTVTKQWLRKTKVDIVTSVLPNSQALITDMDCVSSIALNWMRLLDKDQSGTINLDEFNLSIKMMDNIELDDEEIQIIFESFDITGNGILSIEELGNAIRDVLVDNYYADESLQRNVVEEDDPYGMEDLGNTYN